MSRYRFWTLDFTCYLSVHNVLRGVINVISVCDDDGISEAHKVVLDFARPIFRNISVNQFCHALFLFLNKTENFIHWIFFYFKFICFGFFFHKITQILVLTKQFFNPKFTFQIFFHCCFLISPKTSRNLFLSSKF